MPDRVLAIVAQEVGVAVAGVAERSLAERHQAAADLPFDRHLEVADRSLVIRQPQMLRPVLRRDVDRHAGGERALDHRLVETLGVEVDLDPPSASLHAVEHRLPELVAALFDPALAMNPQGDGGDRGTGAQDGGKGVATVGSMRVRPETFDEVTRARAVGELVAVHPHTELEVHAAGNRLLADEAQRVQVAVALGVAQIGDANTVAGDVDEERIQEQAVAVGDLLQRVVPQAEAEVQPIEARAGQHRQILRPHLAIGEPRRVELGAGELPHHAADEVGGMLDHRRGLGQGADRIGAVAHAIGELGQCVTQAARIGAAGDRHASSRHARREDREAFRPLADRHTLPRQCGLREWTRMAGGDHAHLVRGSVLCTSEPAKRHPSARQCQLELALGPLGRDGRGDRVGRIGDHRDAGRAGRAERERGHQGRRPADQSRLQECAPIHAALRSGL